MMFEVLETSWGTLQARLKSAEDLDDIIGAHDSYVSDILGKALLHPESGDVSAKLNEVKRLHHPRPPRKVDWKHV